MLAKARGQHGVISREQLFACGASDKWIERRLRTGWLNAVHAGVYAIGAVELRPDGRFLAATLAIGAPLGYRSASTLWGIHTSARERIEISCPRHGNGTEKIEVHRATLDQRLDVTKLRGVPTTTLPRTLLDIASVLRKRQLEQALDRAEELSRYDHNALTLILNRYPTHPGNTKLRRALQHPAGSTLTESELEELFLSLCDTHGLPRPQTNYELALPGQTHASLDAYWADRRFAVEVDGPHHREPRQPGARQAPRPDPRRDLRHPGAADRRPPARARAGRDDPARRRPYAVSTSVTVQRASSSAMEGTWGTWIA